jgi:hypothetical protein
MTRILTLAALLSLTLAASAHAGAFSDRLHQNEQRQKQSDEQERADRNIKQQLALQHDVYAFAAKHGGLRDAGECTPEAVTTCSFLAICVPLANAHLTLAQLSTVTGRGIDRCEVALGDGSACVLTNDFDVLWNARKSDSRIPKLKATCLDARNQSHESFQY